MAFTKEQAREHMRKKRADGVVTQGNNVTQEGDVTQICYPNVTQEKVVFKLSDSDRSSGYLCGDCKLRYTNSWRLGFNAGRGLGKKEVVVMPEVGTDCPKCKTQHEKGGGLGVNAGRIAGPVERTYPNYDINPAHKDGCNCGVCIGDFDKKEAVKELKKAIRG